MIRSRELLSQKLREALPGIKNFYFTPPNGTQMHYPCCIYELVGDSRNYADNIPFLRANRYTVTIIDKNPDSDYSDRLMDALPYCSFDRKFTMDNMNHFVHTLYY